MKSFSLAPPYSPALLAPLLLSSPKGINQPDPISNLGTQSHDLMFSFESISSVALEFSNA